MRAGQSVLELLIVVVIMTALTGAAVPFFLDAHKEALLRDQQKLEQTMESKSFMCFSTEEGMICKPTAEKED